MTAQEPHPLRRYNCTVHRDGWLYIKHIDKTGKEQYIGIGDVSKDDIIEWGDYHASHSSGTDAGMVLDYLRYWIDYDENRERRLILSEKDSRILRGKIDEIQKELRQQESGKGEE